MSDLAEKLTAKAIELGFDGVGWAPAEELTEEGECLRRWLADGRHGTMQWLAKDPARRANPALVLPEVRTVIVLTMNYLREPLSPDSGAKQPTPGLGKIARYARTRDYHRVIEKRLRVLCRWLDEQGSEGSQSRGFVDYGPVMERPWALRAGLGFTGKHTLVIDPKRGSFFFLAVILTNVLLPDRENIPPITESCGNCRRCIDVCPTGAITEPYRLDARKCLSYLTIEHQGAIDPEFYGKTEGWIFGCDLCQEVCPYNQARGRPISESPLGPLLVDEEVPLEQLINAPEEFLAHLGEVTTPLRRAGAQQLRRNALLVAAEIDGPLGDTLLKDSCHIDDASMLRKQLQIWREKKG